MAGLGMSLGGGILDADRRESTDEDQWDHGVFFRYMRWTEGL
jgi:hypothetical protein